MQNIAIWWVTSSLPQTMVVTEGFVIRRGCHQLPVVTVKKPLTFRLLYLRYLVSANFSFGSRGKQQTILQLTEIQLSFHFPTS